MRASLTSRTAPNGSGSAPAVTGALHCVARSMRRTSWRSRRRSATAAAAMASPGLCTSHAVQKKSTAHVRPKKDSINFPLWLAMLSETSKVSGRSIGPSSEPSCTIVFSPSINHPAHQRMPTPSLRMRGFNATVIPRPNDYLDLDRGLAGYAENGRYRLLI